jgi:SNF2 family DNA or RNA helicase
MTIHGSERHDRFEDIKGKDVILTTYPLLIKDEEKWLKEDFHTIILDEAHYIKNAKAKVSMVASKLKADHRLCLTGTPVENHLGELWALFNFAWPGFLGSEREFNQFFKNPIEKEGNNDRQKALIRRISPFILRRHKQDVASDLPLKTEIIKTCSLDKQQKDLYETMRIAMHEKVQEAISQKGLAKSHIIVLDALLKLRQICCDPRLVKSETAKKVHQSSKLALLLEMLEEMLEEGRKILLFSQFTSMLALIEEELHKKKISYVKLTGDTQDRQTVVKQFQEGEVPLFLISLKAGGVGLNLTAADTVIHYDPWWNPAAENQATDRAHRIGQEKPVFVYKLIAEKTIEEKILDLQNKKKAIAQSILENTEEKITKLSAQDIQELFA